MSIYEVTNLDTGDVELFATEDRLGLHKYFKHTKVATLNPNDHLQVTYYLDGRLHRKDGPAAVWITGHSEYYERGDYCGVGVNKLHQNSQNQEE